MKTLAKLLLTIGVGVTGPAVPGCTPAEAPPSASGPGGGTGTSGVRYSISGSVRDATGAGIANVTIRSDDGSSTTTDSEGKMTSKVQTSAWS